MLGVSHSRLRFALVFIAASFTRVERTRDSRGVIALVRIVRNSADAVGVYLTAFVVWSVYRYYYLPVATYMYTYKIGRAQLFSVALIIMAFLSLLSLAAILRSDKT